MKFELNFGLNIAGEANTGLECESRALSIVQALRDFGCEVGYRIVTAEYVGPDGLATERTLVACVSVAPDARIWDWLYSLAMAFKQDCVAVFSPDAGAGLLVGPYSAKWGRFNPEYFVRYESA